MTDHDRELDGAGLSEAFRRRMSGLFLLAGTAGAFTFAAIVTLGSWWLDMPMQGFFGLYVPGPPMVHGIMFAMFVARARAADRYPDWTGAVLMNFVIAVASIAVWLAVVLPIRWAGIVAFGWLQSFAAGILFFLLATGISWGLCGLLRLIPPKPGAGA